MDLKDNEIYTQIPAEDINRAKKFYTEMLGLELLWDVSKENQDVLLFRAGKGYPPGG